MKMLKIILILAVLAAVAAAGFNYLSVNYTGTPDGQDQDGGGRQEPEEPNQADTFREENGYYLGRITLTGYASVQTRVCNPGDMCQDTVDYVTFMFQDSQNAAIKEFAGEQQGNAYLSEQGIGIGCHQPERSRIFYENFSDEDEIQGEIAGDEYQRLMASSRENPVRLTMERKLYTSGRGAPDCYSHFRDFRAF